MTSFCFSLQAIATELGAVLEVAKDLPITRLSSLDKAQAGDISFFTNPKYRQALLETNASAVVLRKEDLPDLPKFVPLLVEDPTYAYLLLAKRFQPVTEEPLGIDPTVQCHPSSRLGTSVRLHPYVILGANNW